MKFTRGDFFGGLTAGIVALPLALAFGVQSGLGAAAGLYGAIFLGFFASLLGGTPSQISGPTGPMTVITTATVVLFVSKVGDISTAMGAIIACFILAGIFQVLMGIFKIGTLIKFIPYPVISGFMSGIGVIIILLQLFPALGQSSPKTTLDVVKEIGPALQNINVWALIYATLTILIIYLFPRLTKAVPSTLVALLVVTLLSVILNYDVPVIGEIPYGFPPLQIGNILSIDTGLYIDILEVAATLAALGAIDSLLTSVVSDNVTKTKHDSNKELIGQGIGNSISGMFGGLPGAGATMRTLVNIRSGGRNRISGIIHSLVLLVILLGLGTYAALIPSSVLAGILITVGIGILDYKGFRHVAKVPKADAAIMIIVLFVTVFLDLLVAVGIGMVMASFLFMKNMSDVVQEKSGTSSLESLDGLETGLTLGLPEELKKKVFIKQFEGPLFFGSATSFQSLITSIPDVQFVIYRMENVPFMDQSGLYALEDSILALEQRNIEVLLCGLQDQPRARLERIQLIPGLVSLDNIFAELPDAVKWISEHAKILNKPTE